ncbi:oligoendopeptidase F [Heyndrickxia acidicola]|uniref:Oligopeptidase F n=1 Tax=Heyndrickxia acidicola TaxID=209389 RepID=A0ABU6MLG9_9BACI|nr:oligoendopeptidase F [Heyndrickxia acidicola]MED1205538.1 oligoendopeptidase F [Heyndrickxia acidicola]
MKHYQSREEIPVSEKWDLTDIFSAVKEWENSCRKLEKLIQDIGRYNGNIHDAKDLLDYLKLDEKISTEYNLVYVYAMLSGDLDTRDTKSQSLLDRASQLGVKIKAATSFFMPYLLSIKEDVLKSYIEETEGLRYFEKDLMDSYRFKDHVLSKDQEEVLSQLGEALSAPSKTYGMLNNADIKFGEVTLENGEKTELTRGMFSKLIEDENREVRKEAYKAYYKPYLQLKNSIASTLSSSIKNNVTLSKLRNYPSALEKSLFNDKVPEDVYNNLIETTKKNVGLLHRYNEVRKEKLELTELRQYDLSVNLVRDVKKEISYNEAYDIMMKALAPLGEEYLNILGSFKEKRYVDVRETPGKRSGAYNLGVYGVHPFVLLNHHDDLDSLFTLAHEMGHAMHSYFSHLHQPRISAYYTIFVAEVASTVNEVLLIHYLLNEAADADLKKHLINHFIDKFKGTFFTQVMFAEFEKITHEMAEKGMPLNLEAFNDVYEKLFSEYNGEVLQLDEEVKYGWSRIPHFYRPFYVYKYATGFASAIQIAEKLLDGDRLMQKSYSEFLKSGSSDYPLELLRKTGVDLTKPEPIEQALSQFKSLLDDFAKQ